MKNLLRNSSFQVALAAIVFWVVVAVIVFVFANNRLNQPIAVPPEGMVYEVPMGASLQKVAQDLKAAGLVSNDLWVRLHSRLYSGGAQIKAGEYRLDPNLTLPQLMALLESGRIIEYPVKFLEGWTFADVKRELARQQKLEQKLPELSDAQIMESLGRQGEHPEGLFFPDTYLYHKGMSDIDVLRVALRKMDQVLAEEWEKREQGLPIKTPYEALILASIVEKETGVGHERPMIAGVFTRRLEQGMRLQTDPTVIYGLGDTYQGNLTRKNLLEETPYNTYKISGLPPTPIALPGRGAIHAALHPAGGKELFFVARGDGSHEFTETLEQHQNAVYKYQIRDRRSDYRSSPQSSPSN